jgi:hypothetical protein
MNRTSATLLAQNPQVLKRLAKYMALHCFRNTALEDFHAGITPSSQGRRLLGRGGEDPFR